MDEQTQEQPKQRKGRKLPVAVTREEYEDIQKVTTSQKQKVAFYLGFNSGLRVSEVIKLEPRDFDLVEGKIFIRQSKGKKDRIAPLPKGFLKKYLDLLPMGITKRALQKGFRIAAKKSGLLEKKPNVRFHSLRHGFATYFLEQGGNIQLLKVLMGHTNIATTDIYNQLNPKVALDAYKELF
jgi:integrase/recombinase XerD